MKTIMCMKTVKKFCVHFQICEQSELISGVKYLKGIYKYSIKQSAKIVSNMDFYNLSQQDFHVLEEKFNEDPEILKNKDSNDRLLLHWACLAGREQLVDHILKNSMPEIDSKDDTEATPLILSVLGGHYGLVQSLVSKGADVNAKKQGGHSALQYAVSKGFKNIVEFLLKNKANVNITDDRNDTPLHRAATLGRLAIAKILIENGANVNCQNRELNTPLHLALEDEQVEIGYLLLDNGADYKLLNRAKQTAIDLCKPNIKRQVKEKYGKGDDNDEE
ncbi:hypothetical protein PVAND_013796 [Polypedilum vanderplanki]|uniref:26S proteasome non-ATPase regulatory subunit 10 n=1 Tax=Polypedilum vanderplanki TaxID=319348 RepID=A0A9J6CSN0_POLVA|nr:hypothetical protein PVAND_013796 [Polypedilum vanderplanki]